VEGVRILDKILELLALAWGSPIIKLVILAVVMDTCFGCIRAIKEHKFNSCFGIDGAIRKISMVASLAFLLVLDQIVHLNLIGFIPEAIRSYLPVNSIGVAEFFGLLYIAYELVSILKNMTLCGLPVKHIWEAIKKFLSQYTDELPDRT
jgi:toxin secretion/phage lysis holin